MKKIVFSFAVSFFTLSSASYAGVCVDAVKFVDKAHDIKALINEKFHGDVSEEGKLYTKVKAAYKALSEAKKLIVKGEQCARNKRIFDQNAQQLRILLQEKI